MDKSKIDFLRALSEEYENENFIDGDPSWFMHQVDDALNVETVAFVASVLSFGSRKAFMPKIRYICEEANWDLVGYVTKGLFKKTFKKGDNTAFYRFFSNDAMHLFFTAYKDIFKRYGSLGKAVESAKCPDAVAAMRLISQLFAEAGSYGVVPNGVSSACKRLAMFMRWMVRDSSPVDMGLWANFIDKRTLVLPLDTHVLTQSKRLGLIDVKSSTMAVARRITDVFAKYVFPDDPCRGDFALFGYGINKSKEVKFAFLYGG